MAKLGVYDPAAKSWGFVHYPLEAPKSPAGGWVGLSEITALGGDRFALIERDNQPGAAAVHQDGHGHLARGCRAEAAMARRCRW